MSSRALFAALLVLLALAPPTRAAVADEREAQRALARQEAYERLKLLGVPVAELGALLDEVEGAADRGEVDVQGVDRVAWLIGDPEAAAKARALLLHHAESLAFGLPSRGSLDEEGLAALPAGAAPRLGGACLACPAFDFGCFTPTTAYQLHPSTITGSGDCNVYCFNVVAGRGYEFTTCSPGMGPLDTVLELRTSSCTLIDTNDDACFLQSRINYCSTTTGTVLLKVRGTGSGSGTYTLAYRDTGPCSLCETCALPGPVLAPPTSACQLVSGSTTASCPSRFYQVFLSAGQCVTFTTCAATCPGASASFDARLRIFDSACGPALVNNDDFCGLGPQVTFSPLTTGTYLVQVTGSSSSNVGSYTLGYRFCNRTCATCLAPRFGPFTPTLACQYAAGAIDSCGQDNFYTFNLVAGTCYEFATCPGTCPLATASFDTVIELFNPGTPSCTRLASDDDACAPQSRLTFTPATTGAFTVRVRGSGNATGSYNLSYRACSGPPCTAPSGVTVTPTTGIVDASCRRTETFTATASGTSPLTFTYTITPPSGGSATPSSGTAAGGGAGPATFTSTLSRTCSGDTFSVTVTATNACGSSSQTISYRLLDVTPPVVVAPASAVVSCDAVPAPAPATATDNCDPAPTITMAETAVPGRCPDQRVITRTYTARDCSGNTATGVQVLTVVDVTPPVLSGVPAAATAECDAVPPPATVTASDNCDPAPRVTMTEVRTPGTCPGRYTLLRTWTATDRCGNVTAASQLVTVVDTTAPVVTSGISDLGCLWPPSHDYYCFVTADLLSRVVARDACSEPVTLALVGLGSDQPDDATGDGHTTMDSAIVTEDGTFCVRSERRGNSPADRHYYALVVATDACGNATEPFQAGVITVHHDSRDLRNRNCLSTDPPRDKRPASGPGTGTGSGDQ